MCRQTSGSTRARSGVRYDGVISGCGIGWWIWTRPVQRLCHLDASISVDTAFKRDMGPLTLFHGRISDLPVSLDSVCPKCKVPFPLVVRKKKCVVCSGNTLI
ncbi:uncharacterized protein LOC113468944 [Diaphorina citri]|uniref:Uncharacterized protein LOC113468944 n=1 Tax=Diaphorina citri TaxID=121845 RepID=A0A3Q0J5T1_DIACI|nr:uncharacterized protein LOC113468944 [Diaphorina citri]